MSISTDLKIPKTAKITSAYKTQRKPGNINHKKRTNTTHIAE